MSNEQQMGDKEAEAMIRSLAEGKANMHSFFTKVIQSKSTTKVGNLNEDELGMPKLPLRTLLELDSFSKTVADEQDFATYFNDRGEILTASSLSKEGFLMKLAVTMKKELADVTPNKAKKNTGWFKRKGGGEPAT